MELHYHKFYKFHPAFHLVFYLIFYIAVYLNVAVEVIVINNNFETINVNYFNQLHEILKFEEVDNIADEDNKKGNTDLFTFFTPILTVHLFANIKQ